MSELFVSIWPEILLLVVGSLLLLFGTAKRPSTRRIVPVLALLSLLGIFFGLLFAAPADHTAKPASESLLIYRFQDYVKLISAGAGALLVLLAWPTNRSATGNTAIQYGHETGEFFGLMLLSIAGIFFVASANDIIVLFLGIELASIPTYIMVSISRPMPVAQEAGVKYFFLGAMAAAVMLFGFSYLYGTTGHTNLQEIANSMQMSGPNHDWQLLALVMVILGFGFKIAAVPLHAYAADVYQGAATPVTAFLAFVPKTSGFVALIKILFYAGQVGQEHFILPDNISKMLWVLAVLTMFVGNVMGLLQHNIKRVLAYSSIAHSGYMLVGVTTIVTAQGHPDIQAAAVAGVLFYLAAYAIMNTGAFGVLMMLPSREAPELPEGAEDGAEPAALGTSAETFEDIAGQGRRFLPLGIAMAVCCWSLTGLPFTIGFFGKFFLIKPALMIASDNQLVRSRMTWLVVLLVINAAISAAYYLKIIGAMFLRAEPTSFYSKSTPRPSYDQYRPAQAWPVMASIAISVIGTLALGVYLPATSNLADRSQATEIQGTPPRIDAPIVVSTQPATAAASAQ